MKKATLFCTVLLLISLVGCSKKSDSDSSKKGKATVDFSFKNEKENLKALFESIYSNAHGGDNKKAAALTRTLLPTEAQLKSVIKEGVSEGMIQNVVNMHKKFQFPAGAPEKAVALSLVEKKAQSEVQVHGATTEEIIAYAKGGAAYNEFPGGARRVAQAMLKSGVTFYEVELLEPGKTRGMKFHLFFWNGSSWSMFGPAWRAVQ